MRKNAKIKIFCSYQFIMKLNTAVPPNITLTKQCSCHDFCKMPVFQTKDRRAQKSPTDLEGSDDIVDKDESTQSIGDDSHMSGNNITVAMSHILRELYLHLQVFSVNTTSASTCLRIGCA